MKAFRTAFWVWLVVMVFLVAAELFPAYWGTIHFSGFIFCVIWFFNYVQNK